MTEPLGRAVSTPVGTARVAVDAPPGRLAAGRLVLGHGAGGGTDSLDLRAARDAALAQGLQVVRVEQPWRVQGRRVAEAPVRLDVAWRAVLAALDDDRVAPPVGGPLVVGGRSAGARVACRTADDTGAAAVLALAFPLHPPGRPGRSRLDELRAPQVPRLVVQGERDAFGQPAQAPGVRVHVVAGADHAFAVRRRDGRAAQEVADEVAAVVGAWLQELLAGPALTQPQTLT